MSPTLNTLPGRSGQPHMVTDKDHFHCHLYCTATLRLDRARKC
jgi:hypothetical protein